MSANSITRGNLKIEFTELGEGLSGDYDPDDPSDIEQLRFDTFEKIDGKWEEWNEGSNYSFCTMFPVSATPTQRRTALSLMMDVAYPAFLRNDGSLKSILQRLSWIDLAVVQTAKSRRQFLLAVNPQSSNTSGSV